MTTKDYLNQAFRIDQRISSKLEQIESLKALATRVTTTLSDMPRIQNSNHAFMDDIVIKIMSFENDIKHDVDMLLSLKKEISDTINRVEHVEYRTLLELRYLCFYSWEDIAYKMSYTKRNVLLMHKKALSAVHSIRMA